ncbi:MAG: DinB family protein [Pyrinomonadaceae bacterium]
MPMTYAYTAIPDSAIPRASSPTFQHMLDTYASETNKVVSVWREFSSGDMAFRPHPRSSTVQGIFNHQLLSERRFFGEFPGLLEPPATQLQPEIQTPEAHAERLAQLVLPRLSFIAAQAETWWLEQVPFFDVERERIWVFWRRLLHTAHHRTQLTVYLRLLGKRVPSVYGPTADETWAGADSTSSAEAASRK